MRLRLGLGIGLGLANPNPNPNPNPKHARLCEQAERELLLRTPPDLAHLAAISPHLAATSPHLAHLAAVSRLQIAAAAAAARGRPVGFGLGAGVGVGDLIEQPAKAVLRLGGVRITVRGSGRARDVAGVGAMIRL